MRYRRVVVWMLLWWVSSATAQISIGINLSFYPELVPVPGYPVYYAPGLNSNFFFYDGMYWVYQDDNWYASSWYNGPWGLVAPWYVPLFILRIPVGYYRHPPVYFREWRPDAPPHWGERWGEEWEHRRHGWDRWDRRSAPPPAPLPAYQQQYSGDRYPGDRDQQRLHDQYYQYQPQDDLVRRHHQGQEYYEDDGRGASPDRPSRQQDTQRIDAPALQPNASGPPTPWQKGDQDFQRPDPAAPQQREPAFQRRPPSQSQDRPIQPERSEHDAQRPAPPQQREPVAQPQQQRLPPLQREQQMPRSNQEGGRGAPQDTRQGQEKDRARGDERDHDRY